MENGRRLITRISNRYWTKNGVEWLWVKISAIVGILCFICIFSSGGKMNIFGVFGLILTGLFILILILAIITYPFKDK
jgi:hypothetical protein